MRLALLAFAIVTACSAEHTRPRLELVEAPAVQDVAVYVSGALADADRAHKKLLVYVGAAWCEPCRRFHEAAAAGQLDATFGDLRMLVFDADRDKDALQRAGYISNLIPLFALPRPDGTASGKQIEGSIKGDGAVAQITPRLQALLQ
jgi:thiol-disulfide isomerase/thioredoxin